MIRISRALDFGLDRRQRLGRVDISQCGIASNRHFDNRFGVIADQVTSSYVALNTHEIVEETARPDDGIPAPAFNVWHDHERAALRIKGGNQPVDERNVDLRHVAKADNGRISFFGYGTNASF